MSGSTLEIVLELSRSDDVGADVVLCDDVVYRLQTSHGREQRFVVPWSTLLPRALTGSP